MFKLIIRFILVLVLLYSAFAILRMLVHPDYIEICYREEEATVPKGVEPRKEDGLVCWGGKFEGSDFFARNYRIRLEDGRLVEIPTDSSFLVITFYDVKD